MRWEMRVTRKVEWQHKGEKGKVKPSVKIKIADRWQKKVRRDASGQLKKVEYSEVGKRWGGRGRKRAKMMRAQ